MLQQTRRDRRYTAHLNSGSGRYYIFDHLTGRPLTVGIASEAAAWSDANNLQREWLRQVARWVRAEHHI